MQKKFIRNEIYIYDWGELARMFWIGWEMFFGEFDVFGWGVGKFGK